MGMSGHASGEAVVGVTIGMTLLAGMAVISRLLTRSLIVKNAGVDDLLIVFALLFSVATTITMCLQVRHGMGQHQDSLSAEDQLAQLKPFWVSIWVYNLAISCTKFSILFQYLRIFPDRKFRWACFGLIAVVFVYTCWTFFSAVFACTPVQYFWNPSIQGGHCLNRFAVWFANAGINIVTDVATAALPLPVFKSLELPKRQKYALMAVFALGSFTCVVSILRLQSLYVISRATDISWNNPLAAIWSSVEINTGILCSCLPTLKACISRYFPRIFSTRHTRTGTKQRSNPAAGATPNHYAHGSRGKIGFDELGRGLSGRGEVTQKSFVRSRVDAESGSDDIELDRTSPKRSNELDDGQIHVFTVVQQEEHRQRDAESDSTKGLVRETFYNAR